VTAASRDQVVTRFEWRFGPAGLGLVWLPILAVLAALYLAGVGGCAVLAGHALDALVSGTAFFGHTNIRIGPFVFGSLLLSLIPLFWTVVAGLVGAQILVMASAEDCIVLDQRSLRVTHRIGPFRWADSHAIEDVRAVFALPQSQRQWPRLVAHIGEQLVVLSNLASPIECPAAAQQIRDALGLQAESGAVVRPALPAPWRARRDPSGALVLACPAWRSRVQAFALGAYALGCAIALGALLWDLTREPEDTSLIGSAVMAAVAGLGLNRLAARQCWLDEWWITAGQCEQRKRFGQLARIQAQVAGWSLTRLQRSGPDWWFSVAARTVDVRGRAHSVNLLVDTDLFLPCCLLQWLDRQSGLTALDATRDTH
jgi:hypothetical protein